MSKVWEEEEWRAGNPSGSERGELFDAEGENLGSFNTLPSRDYDDSEEAYARARLAGSRDGAAATGMDRRTRANCGPRSSYS